MILRFNNRFKGRFRYHPNEFRYFYSLDELERYYIHNQLPKKNVIVFSEDENYFLYLGKKYVNFENYVFLSDVELEKYSHKFYKLLFNGFCIYSRSHYFDNEDM